MRSDTISFAPGSEGGGAAGASTGLAVAALIAAWAIDTSLTGAIVEIAAAILSSNLVGNNWGRSDGTASLCFFCAGLGSVDHSTERLCAVHVHHSQTPPPVSCWMSPVPPWPMRRLSSCSETTGRRISFSSSCGNRQLLFAGCGSFVQMPGCGRLLAAGRRGSFPV